MRRLGLYAVLVAAAGMALVPFAWGLSTSLKTADVVTAYPPRWLPMPVTLENYARILASGIPGYMANTLVVAALTIGVALAVGFHGACGARYRFPGRRVYLLLILMSMMLPGIGLLVPQYLMVARAGLLNSHVALALIYAAGQAPFVVWLLVGFVQAVPRELEESAWLDGCSRLRALYLITLPLVRPGLVAAALVVFLYVWNEFIITLTLTTAADKRLLAPGLYALVTGYGIEWGPLMAGVLLAVLPVIVLFFCLEQYFVRGLMSGAMKG